MVSFKKPIFISYCAFLGLAAYFPFSGLATENTPKTLIKKGLAIAGLQFAAICFLSVGLNILPISTSIIVRVSADSPSRCISTTAPMP